MTSAITTVWQQLTFASGAPQDWVKYSYLHRLVGSLASWRRGSWLMQWGDTLGMVLATVLFCLAPFVSTTLIGVMMLACGLFWALLTLSDDDGPGVTPIHILVLLY